MKFTFDSDDLAARLGSDTAVRLEVDFDTDSSSDVDCTFSDLIVWFPAEDREIPMHVLCESDRKEIEESAQQWCDANAYDEHMEKQLARAEAWADAQEDR